jgi:hypothetical protein
MAAKGVSFRFDQQSLANVKKNLEKLNLNGRKVAAEALYTTATFIGNESQALVPVDTGVLRGSMDISRQKSFTQATTRAEISYGGPAAPYALIQHENQELNHPKGGVAKYLETPFLKHTDGFPESFIQRMEAERPIQTWIK